MDSLTYIGHATTLLRLDGAAILTDPMLRAGLGPLRRQVPAPAPGIPGMADLVLISHLHRDHLDLPSLRRLPATTPLLVPRGAGRWVTKSGAERIREIGRGETVSIAGVEVIGVPAVHNGYRDGRMGVPIEPLGYVVSSRRRRAYFAGDTDLFEGMSDLGEVDLALLPVAGWGPPVGEGHLDPARAARALQLIRPRLAVPIHWGTFYPLGLRRLRPEPLVKPPLEFAEIAGQLAPGTEVRVLRPGDTTALGDG